MARELKPKIRTRARSASFGHAALLLSSLRLATACTAADAQIITVDCDDEARYCISRVDLVSPDLPARLEFEEPPSAFAFDIRGGNVGVAELAVVGGPVIVSDYALLGQRLLPDNSGESAWLPVRMTSIPDELSTDYELRLGGGAGEVRIWHRYPESLAQPRQVDVHIVVDLDLGIPAPKETVAAALDFWGMQLGALTTSETLVPEDALEIGPHLWPPGFASTPHLTVVALDDIDSIYNLAGFAVMGAPEAGGGFAAYIATATDDPAENADADRLLLAHEIGHMAGLLHTTDADGPDPLSDTRACDPETLSETPGECEDANNVMFALRTGHESTEQQRQIVQDSLLSVPLHAAVSQSHRSLHPRPGPGALILCEF